jgi:hypothetical protein
VRDSPREQPPFGGEPHEDAHQHDEEESLASEDAARDTEPRQVLTDRPRREVREHRFEEIDRSRGRLEQKDGGEVTRHDQTCEDPPERLGERPRHEDSEEHRRRHRLVEARSREDRQDYHRTRRPKIPDRAASRVVVFLLRPRESSSGDGEPMAAEHAFRTRPCRVHLGERVHGHERGTYDALVCDPAEPRRRLLQRDVP